jgi:hypothetical protein
MGGLGDKPPRDALATVATCPDNVDPRRTFVTVPFVPPATAARAPPLATHTADYSAIDDVAVSKKDEIEDFRRKRADGRRALGGL